MSEQKRRIRISVVERAANASALAMRLAREALIQNVEGITEQQAQMAVLAIRGGVVPGVKMEIVQP